MRRPPLPVSLAVFFFKCAARAFHVRRLDIALGDEFAIGLVNHEVAIHERNFRHLVAKLRLDIAFPQILRFVHMAVGVDDFVAFPHKHLQLLF